MILLPDEDEEPVGAQVYAVIGEALRQSVADAALSPGFAARLATALDAEGPDAQVNAAAPGSAAGLVGPAGTAGAGRPATGEAGQGSEAAEVAS